MRLHDLPLTPASARTFRFCFTLADDPAEHDPFAGVRPQFFLRRDFAAELGFLMVLPEEPATPLPQNFLYGGLSMPDPETPKPMVPFISDGRRYICPDAAGLFSLLETKIGSAAPAGLAQFVYPGTRKTPSGDMTFGPYLVMHSAVTGMAQILPTRQAIRKVLAANGYEKGEGGPKTVH